jgi:hypothetical protein
LGAQFFSQRVNGVEDLQSQARAQDIRDNEEKENTSLWRNVHLKKMSHEMHTQMNEM